MVSPSPENPPETENPAVEATAANANAEATAKNEAEGTATGFDRALAHQVKQRAAAEAATASA